MLDVTRLRVLVAVARYGSVTAAARELNYAQPSVSHHIARLEAETGARLLQRAGRGIRLTDAGRLLAERAEEILGRLDAAENELAAHVGLREGRVRLAAFPSALGTIVPAAAACLETESPGMDLMLAEAEPPEALRMLRAGYVDVALVFRHYQESADDGPPGGDDEGARGVLLLDEPVHLITRAAGPHDARWPETGRSDTRPPGVSRPDPRPAKVSPPLAARLPGPVPPTWPRMPDAAGSPAANAAGAICSASARWRDSPRRSRSPRTTTLPCRRWSQRVSGWPRCPISRSAQPVIPGSAPSPSAARAGMYSR